MNLSSALHAPVDLISGAMLGAALMFSSAKAGENPRPVRPPNVVLIQLDDLGYDDLALHGNRLVETPYLDRLGRESVRFRDFIVNPVCAPSRATLLTGRHYLRTGVSHVHGGKDYLNLREQTLAEYLKAGGYATGMWGKWHLGKTEGYLPWQRGFDEAYMAQLYRHENTRGSLNGQTVEHQQWGDEVMVDYTLDFIRRHKDQPFFAYLPSMTPHEPLAAPPDLVRHYQAKGLSPEMSRLYAMITFLDRQIGRLLAGIKEMGLDEQTLILFMSDNGPAISVETLSDADRAIRKVNGLRGWKGDIWENGVRSPLFVRWAGHLTPREIDGPADLTDMVPTILALTGVSLPPAHLPLDGQSLADVLKGTAAPPKDRIIFNFAHQGWPPISQPGPMRGHAGQYDPISAEGKNGLAWPQQVISARQGRYKLLLNPNYNYRTGEEPVPERVLVDLESDPRELINVATLHPEETQRLEGALQDWFARVLKEPASFGMPVFLVGQDPQRDSLVAAVGPCRLSPGLVSGTSWLSGWKKGGDSARYQIAVRRAGKYQAALVWKNPLPAGWVFRLQVKDASVQGGLADHKETVLGELDLPEGNAILQVELKETGAAKDNPAAGDLSGIVFRQK